MTHGEISTYEHCSEIGSWRFLYRPAPRRLRPFLMGISAFERVVRPHGGHGLGSPSAELVISLGGWSELQGLGRDYQEAFRTDRPFVSGFRERSKEYRLETGFTGMLVDLTGLGARRILGAPMSLVVNREVEANEFLGRTVLSLQEQLSVAAGWQARFDLLERFLGSRIEASSPPTAGFRIAWDLITGSRGRIRVQDLRSHLRLSQKKMLQLFRDEVGLTPKRLAELVRFDHALTLATGQDAPPWTSLALRAGYYDQAHLINDFRDRMGLTPTEILTKLRPQASMSGRNELGALYSKG